MSSIKCPQCSLMNFATAVSCGRCSFLFQEVKRPMPPIRAGVPVTNLSSHTSGMANIKVQPPLNTNTNVNSGNPVLPNQTVNYQQPLAKTTPQNPTSQQVNQPPKPFQTPQTIAQNPTQVSGVMSNSAERNVAMAEMALETNSSGVVVKILLLPFTIVRKILGFLYSHKKVAALVLAPPAITVVVGPNLLEAIKTANENSAIATIKMINQAQTTFLATKYRCGELKELEQNQLIDSSISAGTKSGYIFTVGRLPEGCEVYAKPTEKDGLTATGNRSFYFSSRDNTLRVSVDKNVLATGVSPAMDVGGDIKQQAEKPKIATAK